LTHQRLQYDQMLHQSDLQRQQQQQDMMLEKEDMLDQEDQEADNLEDPEKLLLMRAWRAWRLTALSDRFMISWTGAGAQRCLGSRCMAGWRAVVAGRKRRRLLG
jgi:hypothetical protein